MNEKREKILIIKLGALGDFAQAMGPIAAIRARHKDAHLTLLTTPPYENLARAWGGFDEIWTDGRPRGLLATLTLLRRMSWAKFDRVYDLQTNDRSSLYFHLLWPRPEWSGIARGCSHPHANPGRDDMHTLERQREQLAMAGIEEVPFPDFSWVERDISRFGLPARFALIVPGGAPHRPAKRWPAESYAELAKWLAGKGLTPVILGAGAEAGIAAGIAAACPEAINLVGDTGFQDIIALGRAATAAIGNDTGPMHLLAFAGAPCLVLYSHESDPAKCAQRGPAVSLLRVPDLRALPVAQVAEKLAEMLKLP